MAKRRTTPTPRKARKVMNLNQTVQRKRSEKKFHRSSAFSQELDRGSAARPEEASRPQANNTRQDLWNLSTGMANQFAGTTLENYARTISALLPAAGRQEAWPSLPMEITPITKSSALMRGALQAANRELLEHFIEQVHRNLEAMSALARTRSPQDLFSIQSNFAKAQLNSLLEATSRLLIIAIEMTTEAVRINQLRRSQAVPSSLARRF